MAIRKCSNGKYRINDGICEYSSRAAAVKAEREVPAKGSIVPAGTPKHDGSGRGIGANVGRGGCAEPEASRRGINTGSNRGYRNRR